MVKKDKWASLIDNYLGRGTMEPKIDLPGSLPRSNRGGMNQGGLIMDNVWAKPIQST